MHCVKISIQGGDSAHRQRMQKISSRVWPFPDGRERVVTMSGWHWEAYDQMVAPCEVREVANTIYELAQQEIALGTDPTLDFEDWIQRMAQDLVRLSWDDGQNEKAANNNGVLDYSKRTS